MVLGLFVLLPEDEFAIWLSVASVDVRSSLALIAAKVPYSALSSAKRKRRTSSTTFMHVLDSALLIVCDSAAPLT